MADRQHGAKASPPEVAGANDTQRQANDERRRHPANVRLKSRVSGAATSDCAVKAEDIGKLDPIRELLLQLNDSCAENKIVTELVKQTPALAARCVRHAQITSPLVETADRALMLIGNRGLEAVLLEFLEDLTILKAELEEAS